MVKIGVLLPTRGELFYHSPKEAVSNVLYMARTCENSGIDSVWVGDSLTAKPRLDPLTMLTAIAMVTKNVRLGTSVLLPVLRNPIQLSQAINTLNAVCNDRLTLGMGIGGAFNIKQKEEWRMAGVDYRDRAKRFEEILEILNQVNELPSVNFQGEIFNIKDVEIKQRWVSDEKIPLIIAAHKRHGINRQFARAVKYGNGLISISDTPSEFYQGALLVDNLLKTDQNSERTFEKIMYMTVNINDSVENAKSDAEEFLYQYYGYDIWGDRWGPFGTTTQIINKMEEYVQSGATTIIIRFAAKNQKTQLRSFIENILPNFKKHQ